MCNPMIAIAAASFATQALGAVMEYQAANEQAKAQEAVERQRFAEQERVRFETAEAAQRDFANKSAQVGLQQVEKAEARSAEIQKVSREQLEAQGTALASATNSGNGLLAVLTDADREAGRATSAIEQNAIYDARQSRTDIESLRFQALDTINSVRPYVPNPVQYPSTLALGVKIAGAGVNAAAGYNNATARKG